MGTVGGGSMIISGTAPGVGEILTGAAIGITGITSPQREIRVKFAGQRDASNADRGAGII